MWALTHFRCHDPAHFFCVLAAVLVSWKQEQMHKEFFFLLLFLSLGAYGSLFS